MDEKEAARTATIRAYAKRIIGDRIEMKPFVYDGTFNYQAVANSVPIPTTSKLTDHQLKWKNLYNAFANAWAMS